MWQTYWNDENTSNDIEECNRTLHYNDAFGCNCVKGGLEKGIIKGHVPNRHVGVDVHKLALKRKWHILQQKVDASCYKC